ncbi:hypothetical protein LWI29_025113 [Acer saccharum]|uniref:Uncharacterized protein n=1 Tax=Acer saccharum TaxID=4024 RepID=A0AA39S4G1_ACESA|nr:hypothetical protein LWI29_025113 [Acer saccharum]
MVLTPTRELCIQVEDQAKLLGKDLPFKTALVVGGDAMAGKIYCIQQGVELINEMALHLPFDSCLDDQLRRRVLLCVPPVVGSAYGRECNAAAAKME